MATRKSIWGFIIGFVAWTCFMGIFTPANAETLNYKIYTHVAKAESVPVGDVDGHDVNFTIRRGFRVFESGEVTTQSFVVTGDLIKGSGSSLQYATVIFSDGPTIYYIGASYTDRDSTRGARIGQIDT